MGGTYVTVPGQDEATMFLCQGNDQTSDGGSHRIPSPPQQTVYRRSAQIEIEAGEFEKQELPK
jgi:hypothetical protein